MVCWALWKVLTVRNYRVVIVTPRESHLDTFWNQIEHQLESSVFRDSVVRQWKRPFRFKQLSNGSTLKGFCTGMSVRSHGCDAMVVDEADRFKEEDWSAFVPLWGETAFYGELSDEELAELGSLDPLGHEVTVFLTTTIRSGTRSRFYHFCTDETSPFRGPKGRDWSFPADQDPDVTSEQLAEWRNRMTQEEFENEILCIWGSSLEGVYRSSYIDRSVYPGSYHHGLVHRHAFTLRGEFLFDPSLGLAGVPTNQIVQRWELGPGPTVIGADWDKNPQQNLGPSIYAVQFDEDPQSPTYQKFRTIFCYQFPYTQYCVLGAVHLIFQLAQRVRPLHIYLEHGFGGDSQAEFLSDLAYQAGWSQLVDVVRVVALNESWEIEHPVTGELSRTQVKQYMVFTCSVLPFEQGRIVLSEEDDRDLVRQLRDYRKVGQTSYGWKFNDEDEHLVDAFNLCMLAMVHEVQPHWDYPDPGQTVAAGPPILPSPDSLGRFEPVGGRLDDADSDQVAYLGWVGPWSGMGSDESLDEPAGLLGVLPFPAGLGPLGQLRPNF